MQKYPSIPNILEVDFNDFVHTELVFTIKMDGSNARMTSEGVFSRSGHAHPTHPSFDMLKRVHAPIAHLIPEGMTIYGEWLYAKHSIHYTNKLALRGYFQVFGVTRGDEYYDWVNVDAWARSLGFETVRVIEVLGSQCYDDGIEVMKEILERGTEVMRLGHEGIVVRNAYSFLFNDADFKKNIVKYVRPDHVQTDEHWSQQPIVRNELVSNGGA